LYFEYICWKFAGRLLDHVNTPLGLFGYSKRCCSRSRLSLSPRVSLSPNDFRRLPATNMNNAHYYSSIGLHVVITASAWVDNSNFYGAHTFILVAVRRADISCSHYAVHCLSVGV